MLFFLLLHEGLQHRSLYHLGKQFQFHAVRVAQVATEPRLLCKLVKLFFCQHFLTPLKIIPVQLLTTIPDIAYKVNHQLTQRGDQVTESKEAQENIQLAARVTREQHTAFHAAAEKHGMPASAILRELVIGFVEGRVTLAPPKHLSDLYAINKE